MKKRSYWVLFAVMVLVGAFLMVFLGSKNQLPVVQDVNAQGMGNYNYTIPHDLSSPGYIFPGDILFPGSIFPGDIILNRTSPSDGNRSGSSSLTTLMTCYGCGQTMSTCNWNCGPTFSNCGSSVIGAGGNTKLFCPTSMNCGISNIGRGDIFPQQNIGGVPYPLTEQNFPENLVWVQGVAMFKPIEYKFEGFGGPAGFCRGARGG